MTPAPLYLAHAALCLLLGTLLAWQALRYPVAAGRRTLRLLAGLVAAGALWLSVYPPHRTVAVASPDAAILLTDHYHPDSLRQLHRRLGPVPLLRYRAPSSHPDTTSLSSLSALARHYPHVRQLHVLGLGVPAADLPALPMSVQVVPHSASVAPAFTAGSWPQRLPLGTALRVEGHFAAAARAPVWVRLTSAGSVFDSVRLPTGSGSFSLRYVPRQTGRLLARLEARQGSQLLATEPVPAKVDAPRKLRVLLLAGTPSFEFNLLKNHLAERGHQVAVRLSVSRGLQQSEFLNQAAADISRLTPALLRSLDALVTDAEALTAFSAAEARLLTAATAEGLGVVLLATDKLPRTLPSRSDFLVLPRATAVAERPQLLHWADAQGEAVLPATLRPSLQLQPLVTTEQPGTVVAAARRSGWGTVVVATPVGTYRWLLMGLSATYASYWSRLLGAAARPLEERGQWRVGAWPRLREPLTVHLSTAAAISRPAQVNQVPQSSVGVALEQLPGQSNKWKGLFWPAQPGWHTVRYSGVAEDDFYVFAADDWRNLLAQERSAAAQSRAASPTTSASASRREAWPAGLFFALFVLAAGWLWLDEKRN